MKKIFIYTITFLLVQQVFSQQKGIIYFDQDWEKTTKENAEYYRFTPLEKKGDFFLLKDYYINGNLQMEGLSSSANKSVYEGKVTWYYKSGNKSVERNYKAGSKEGLTQSYFEDGNIMSTGTYQNDCPFTGTFKKRNFNEFIVRKYEECALIEEYSFYEKTKTIAERHLDYGERYLRFFKSIYYNEKGEVIGELPYKKANHVEEEAGIKVHFSYTNNSTIKERVAISTITNENDLRHEVTYDTKGKLLAKGTYNINNQRIVGSFLENGQVTTYKDGLKEGKETCCYDKPEISTSGVYERDKPINGTFYNTSSKETSSYKNGVLYKEQSIFSNFTKQFHKCIYIEGIPFEGEKFYQGRLTTYKNGTVSKIIDYENNTNEIELILEYDSNQKIVNKTFFKDGKKYELEYRENSPYKGTQIVYHGLLSNTDKKSNLTTYSEGRKNGPFRTEDYDYITTGSYKDSKYEGEIVFVNIKTQETLSCIYVNGKPMDGIAVEDYKIISYKNGKKDGIYQEHISDYRHLPLLYEYLVAYFKEGKPINEIHFFKEDKLIAKGVYKNHKPYNGTFYYNDSIFYRIEYDNGILTERESEINYDSKKIEYFKNKNKYKENVFKNDNNSLIYTLAFINNQPHTGTLFNEFEGRKRSFYYEITEYKNGLKDGLHKTYKETTLPFIVSETYKKGKLNGKAYYNYSHSTKTLKGIYKNGKPYQGVLIKEQKDYIVQTEHNKGVIQTKKYYWNNWRKKSIDSLNYINGKPVTGSDIEFIDDYVLLKKYRNSNNYETNITKEHSNPFFDRPIYIIKHSELRDSLASVPPTELNIEFIVEYSDLKKTSGSLSYYVDNHQIANSIQFKNNKIIKANYKYLLEGDNGIQSVFLTSEDELKYQIQIDDVSLQSTIPNKLLDQNKCLTFMDIFFLRKKEYKTIYSYLKGYDKPLSILNFKNKKPYNGKIFTKHRQGGYNLQTYENDSVILNHSNISREELFYHLNIK